MKYCVFRLYGPLVSWGDMAVGGERRSFTHPTKSAIIGLLAAALGIKRDEEDRLLSLASSISYGVKLYTPGVMLKDFHTAQVPGVDKKVRYYTRKDEMSIVPEKIGTVLSKREYRCDSISIVAVNVHEKNNVSVTVEDIKQALEKPVFHLYLGRKSCPVAVPFMPQIVNAKDLKSAFDNVIFPPIVSLTAKSEQQIEYLKKKEHMLFYNGTVQYYWEENSVSGLNHLQKNIIYDQPLSRARWQFSPRNEYMSVQEENDNVHE